MTLNVIGLQVGPVKEATTHWERLNELERFLDESLSSGNEVDLVVFPELMMNPYFCSFEEPHFFKMAETIDGPTVDFCKRKAIEFNLYIVGTLFEKEETNDGVCYYNTAFLLSNKGELVGKYRKTHIPKLALKTLKTNEKYYFLEGNDLPVFEVKGYRLGILICYDRSFPEAARTLALKGADLIVIPTAAGGNDRSKMWIPEISARARECGLYVLGVNRGGEETISHLGQTRQTHFFGLTCACGPNGELLGEYLDDQSWKSLKVSISKQELEQYRQGIHFNADLRYDLYETTIGLETHLIRTYKEDKETEPLFRPRKEVRIK